MTEQAGDVFWFEAVPGQQSVRMPFDIAVRSDQYEDQSTDPVELLIGDLRPDWIRVPPDLTKRGFPSTQRVQKVDIGLCPCAGTPRHDVRCYVLSGVVNGRRLRVYECTRAGWLYCTVAEPVSEGKT